VRVKRKLQRICCRLYLLIFLENITGRIGCFSMDIAQTRRTMYIYVSLVLCVFVFVFPQYLCVPFLCNI